MLKWQKIKTPLYKGVIDEWYESRSINRTSKHFKSEYFQFSNYLIGSCFFTFLMLRRGLYVVGKGI